WIIIMSRGFTFLGLFIKQSATGRVGEWSIQMLISFVHYDPASGSTLYEPLHDQIRFINLFDRAGFFAHSSTNGSDSNRSTLKFINNCRKNPIVHFIQSVFIYIQSIERKSRDLKVYGTGSLDLCKISYPPKKGICDPWCSSASTGDFHRSFLINGNIQKTSRSFNDILKDSMIIIIQMKIYSKTGTHRRTDQAHSGSRSHQCKRMKGYLNIFSAGPAFDHNINLKILHRRI